MTIAFNNRIRFVCNSLPSLCLPTPAHTARPDSSYRRTELFPNSAHSLAMVVEKVLPAVAAIAALAGCQLTLDHTSCPCADGWVCCASSQICVAEGAVCPGEPDAPQIQRLGIDRPWPDDLFGMGIAVSG